ncbi:hypothetical protein CY34DRAFT_796941 [Suillus luteus UH-Slu-Lm8-n1]|uniref:Uncharacterized protein n=1 Tax=Suillus luteus UH-Slu-Lm8-n1 TaxID=930992 RepID=A0A0D0BJ40_9AGAM|nr:hypothetical protein CY34DRAFT_796941 [Suillus luteus UH-Slu-Lm8-n1]
MLHGSLSFNLSLAWPVSGNGDHAKYDMFPMWPHATPCELSRWNVERLFDTMNPIRLITSP